MQLEIWHIHGDGFHWGHHGLGQEESSAYVPSDTLLAALIARLAELDGPDAAQRLAGALYSDRPPFALTSAFPRAGQALFFPTPLRLPSPAPKDTAQLRPKALKKIRFISEQNFRDLLAGKALSAIAAKSLLLHAGSVAISQGERSLAPAAALEAEKIWIIEKRPRVTVGRAAQNSQIYFTGRTVYGPECGLWFGLRWLEAGSEWRERLQTVWLDLGHAGLGGERSSGFGRCTIEPKPQPLALPDPEGSMWVALSRYLPRPDEAGCLQHPGAAYSLETVGGWANSPGVKSERRRAVRLLVEGSVLGPAHRPVPGQMVDVQPDYGGSRPFAHPVWRSGLAVAVGIQEEAQ